MVGRIAEARQDGTAMLLAVALSLGADAAADMTRPATDGAPIEVDVALFVLDINEIDTAEQSFHANVYIEYTWRDPRLAHDGSEGISRPMAEVWNPRIQIVNRRQMTRTFPEIVEVTPEGRVTYRQRVWGEFSAPMALRDFPFDSQVFHIRLAAAGYSVDEVALTSDPESISGIAPELSLPDWQMLDWSAATGAFQPSPGEASMAGFTFTFEAERHTGYFIAKVIIPLILILAMSWVVFWIDPQNAGPQISVAVTAMLTLIAYRFAVGATMPKVPYLSRLDYFILAATFLVFAALVEVIVTSYYAHAGKLERARAIDLWSRWVFPGMSILVAMETLVLRLIL